METRRLSSGCRLGALLVLGLAACHDGDSGSSALPPVRVLPGGPLAGLTATEQAAFERGREVFLRRFKPTQGLGPTYNATSCESCHSTPTVGGSAPLYRNFYLAMYDDGTTQRALPDNPSAVVPAFGRGNDHTLERGRSVMPATVTGFPVIVGQRNALPIFGVGMFEFVSDADILANADPDDADGDGISGRCNTDVGNVGRFGVKSQSNNIEAFTRAPLKNQLGITSEPFLGSSGIVSLGHMPPRQISADPDAIITDQDDVPDPEISHDDLGDLIAFTRFLAPPEPLTPMSAAAEHGEQLFDGLGCAKCHLPELPTSRFGPSRAYSDLLLHEMGSALADGLNFGGPQTSSISLPNSSQEFRTQPLWGVSLSAPYLHDGRAETLSEAIELHGGEAQAIRDAFVALPAADRADVIAFLEHL